MPWSVGSNVTAGSVLTASRYNQDNVENMTELAPFFSTWTTFTPQLRTGTTNRTSTVTYARYLRVGRLIYVQASVASTAAGGANEQINLALPSGFTYTATPADTLVCGSFQVIDAGTAFYTGAAVHQASGYIYGYGYGGVAAMGQSAPAMTMASSDKISYSVVLEIS